MAKYTLTQNGEIVRFNEIDTFKDLNIEDLKDIIKFTGFFKTPEELRLYLQNHKLIKTNDSLKITYKSKGIRNLKYGISYRDDLKFFSERNLKIFLEQNKNNYALLEALYNHFEDSHSQVGNLVRVKNYMLVIRDNRVALDDSKEICQDFEYTLNDLVSRECHRYDSKNKRNYPQINLRGMRDLGMFLSRCNNLNEELSFDNYETNEFLEYVNSIDNRQIAEPINEERIKVKQKKKQGKKYDPNQITFEDMGWV